MQTPCLVLGGLLGLVWGPLGYPRGSFLGPRRDLNGVRWRGPWESLGGLWRNLWESLGSPQTPWGVLGGLLRSFGNPGRTFRASPRILLATSARPQRSHPEDPLRVTPLEGSSGVLWRSAEEPLGVFGVLADALGGPWRCVGVLWGALANL